MPFPPFLLSLQHTFFSLPFFVKFLSILLFLPSRSFLYSPFSLHIPFLRLLVKILSFLYFLPARSFICPPFSRQDPFLSLLSPFKISPFSLLSSRSFPFPSRSFPFPTVYLPFSIQLPFLQGLFLLSVSFLQDYFLLPFLSFRIMFTFLLSSFFLQESVPCSSQQNFLLTAGFYLASSCWSPSIFLSDVHPSFLLYVKFCSFSRYFLSCLLRFNSFYLPVERCSSSSILPVRFL